MTFPSLPGPVRRPGFFQWTQWGGTPAEVALSMSWVILYDTDSTLRALIRFSRRATAGSFGVRGRSGVVVGQATACCR